MLAKLTRQVWMDEEGRGLGRNPETENCSDQRQD